MSYVWRADAAGASPAQVVAAGLDQRFETQADAELWLSEMYADLDSLGVTSVSLYEEDRLVYGPMSLQAE